MKLSLKHFESEIVNQIHLCELCFDVCDSISVISGRGCDFLPYYYNLNYIKGLISLHSLLRVNKKSELTLMNYIKEYKFNYSGVDMKNFEKKVSQIRRDYEKISKIPLRHKIAAHLDESFSHRDFTSAYIMPHHVIKYKLLVKKVKDMFFEHANYSQTDDPFWLIRSQSRVIVSKVIENNLRV